VQRPHRPQRYSFRNGFPVGSRYCSDSRNQVDRLPGAFQHCVHESVITTRGDSHVNRRKMSVLGRCSQIDGGRGARRQPRNEVQRNGHHVRSARSAIAPRNPELRAHLTRCAQQALSDIATYGPPAQQAARKPSPAPIGEFLSSLSSAWKEGEVRATHRKKSNAPRWWRTRVNPFAEAWPVIEGWLHAHDSVSAARAGIARHLAFDKNRRPHRVHQGHYSNPWGPL
jgi:hypothetical protein